MASGKFVSYIRVSTAKQGITGLGMDAQRDAITRYLNGGSWELIAEFAEVESGKNSNRVELQKALKRCQMTGATLVIAKLDRLSRDPDFLGMLMKAGTEFIACDMPEANKFMIRIMAALAEKEREMISQRTKSALQAAKAKGKTLGNPANLNANAAAKGRQDGVKARKSKADDFAAHLSPVLGEYLNQGLSLRRIAEELNTNNFLTATGKVGKWTATAVRNVIARLDLPSAA